jgi:hypothetical protein
MTKISYHFATTGWYEFMVFVWIQGLFDWVARTLAARELEERQNFEELLTESVGRVNFPRLIMFVLEY